MATTMNRIKSNIKIAIKAPIVRITRPGTLSMFQTRDGGEKYHSLCRQAFGSQYAKRQALAQEFKDVKSITIPEDMGFALWQPNHLPEIAAVQRLAEQIKNNTTPEQLKKIAEVDKAYILKLPIPQKDMQLDSPFLKLAMHPEIVKPIAEYMGILPVLKSVTLMYSPNDQPLEELKDKINQYNSSHFHVDHEDIRQLKVFFFVTEVTEDSGPLTLISAKDTQKIFTKWGTNKFINRLTDEEIIAMGENPKFHPMVGKPGTLAFADTGRCFHFGSRKGGSARLAVWFHYLHPFAQWLPLPVFKGMRKQLLNVSHLAGRTSSELQKYLLGAQ